MGGLEEVGFTKRLLILLYEPGSQQDRDIEEERRETGIATMRSIGIDFSSAWGDAAWGSSATSYTESEASLEDDFAQFLNIDEGELHARARAGVAGAASAGSHVGAADPHIRNLGDGWVLSYASIKSFNPPVDRAAAGLAELYQKIIDLAAGNIATDKPSSKTHGFKGGGFLLKLESADPISWEWIVRFAHALSQAASARWPVLYQAVANSRYWQKAPIRAILVVM
ncbi:MAG: hypothetical protein Q9213_007661 [Squamulea squamosa]